MRKLVLTGVVGLTFLGLVVAPAANANPSLFIVDPSYSRT